MKIQDAINRLRERTQVPLFAVQVWDPELDAALRADSEALFAGLTVRDARMAAAAVAGLHLWNDNFEAAHNLCQGIQNSTGAYWHGICHRREGHQGQGLAANLANARYWFRQAGDHPILDPVYRTALNVLDGSGVGFRWATEAADQLRSRRTWDPAALTDWCGQVDAGTLSGQTASLLEELQWREIGLLTDWCLAQALVE